MRRLFLLLALLTGVSHAAPALSLKANEARQAIQAHMEVYVDATARLDARAVREIDGFQPLPSEHVNVGFSTAAYWVRLRVHNSGASPVQKYLQILNTRLEEVELFTADASGTTRYLAAGIRHPFSGRALPYRTSTFPVSVAPGEKQTLLVRIAGRTAITLAMALWDPSSFAFEDDQQLMGDSVILGMMALLAILCIGLAVATREWAYLYLSAFLLCEIVYEAGMRGTLFALYWGDHPELTVRAIGFAAMPLVQFVRLAMCRMLKTAERQPTLHRMLLIFSIVPLVGAVLCIAGDYYVGTQCLILGSMPLVFLLILAAWRAWRQQSPLSAPWLFGVGSAALGFVPRFTQPMGLPPVSATTYAPSLGVLLGSLIVAVSLFSQLQRDRTKRAIELEKLVHERTRDLDDALRRTEASDAAKGKLLGYIGHDLREPLASLIGLTRNLAPDDDFEQGRRAIERSCLLSLEMIDELQQFARDPKVRGALEVVDAPVYLFGLLQEIKEGTEALAQASGNSFSLTLSASLPAVVVLDARRLRQVLVNLLANAAKFCRDGAISLEARLSDSQDELLIGVRDNGPGIESPDLPYVFQPLVQGSSNEVKRGIGLGLSIVQGVTHAMHGRVSMTSAKNEGSFFEISLPLQTASEREVMWPPARPWVRTAPILPDDAIAVLLEPCESAREALQERLLMAGFTCLTALNLHEAIQLLHDNTTALLVAEPLIDTGFDRFLVNLRAEMPGVSVLLCSSRPCASAEVDGFLLKPAPEEDWWPTLAKAMERRRD